MAITNSVEDKRIVEMDGMSFCYKLLRNEYDEWSILIEGKDRVAFISSCAKESSKARNIFDILVRNTVTPIEAEYIIDEILA